MHSSIMPAQPLMLHHQCLEDEVFLRSVNTKEGHMEG